MSLNQVQKYDEYQRPIQEKNCKIVTNQELRNAFINGKTDLNNTKIARSFFENRPINDFSFTQINFSNLDYVIPISDETHEQREMK